MASIYEHPKSGVYHVSFWYGGHQYRKTLQTKNRRKAEDDAKAVQRAVDALVDGRDKEGVNLLRRGVSVMDVIFPTPAIKTLLAETATKPMLLGELRDRWLDYQRTQGRKKSYVDCEKFRMGPFVRVLGADFRVDQLTLDDLARVIEARRKEGIMEYTIREGLGVLRNVIDRAVRLGWLTANPVKVWPRLKIEARKEYLPKRRVEEMIATSNLTDAEVMDLRARMLLAPEDIAELVALAKERLPQMAVPIALVGVTAIRRGEMITAKRTDLDTTNWTLSVSSDKASTVQTQVRRTIEIHSSVQAMLAEHLKTLKRSDKLLFPYFAQLQGRNCQGDEWVAQRGQKADRCLRLVVRGTPWIMLKGWHTLRHSAISIFLDQGYSFDQIAKWTGHVDPETQKLYTHWFDTKARERMDAIPFEFRGGTGDGLAINLLTEGQEPQLAPEQIRALVAESRALKTQIRRMEADAPLIASLRRHNQLLKQRLRDQATETSNKTRPA